MKIYSPSASDQSSPSCFLLLSVHREPLGIAVLLLPVRACSFHHPTSSPGASSPAAPGVHPDVPSLPHVDCFADQRPPSVLQPSAPPELEKNRGVMNIQQKVEQINMKSHCFIPRKYMEVRKYTRKVQTE